MSSRDPSESTEQASDAGHEQQLSSNLDVSDDRLAQELSTVLAKSAGGSFEWPEQLGRYHIRQQLDRGSYGLVLRAWDPKLRREVAIKIARPDRAHRVSASSFLTEAQTQASLQHPHIAQVFDLGELTDGGVFVVSRFYPGGTLARYIAAVGPRDYVRIASMIADVADGLDHAHAAGVVHRDIKPANVLLDEEGTPVLTDFGLALLKHARPNATGTIGSPAYMSPEQARGESHRVNQCADIYSLGVVLFELLCGQRPYSAGSIKELLDCIRAREIPSVREVDPEIPEELDRICTRALQKRPSDRYQSAREMAAELRVFAGSETRGMLGRRVSGQTADGLLVNQIRPRGLRPFDRNDAGFFLDLLPGLKDKDGLPESIRFWKQRIEPETEFEPFRVGMLWGPSGSGKSSLVRAGLAPTLSGAVVTTITNARASHLEARILQELGTRTTGVKESLAETLADIRDGGGLPAGNKLFLVVDQFEQFLHRSEDLRRTELAECLRQCDGKRVQALLIVRDDFVSAANQFMEMLEEPLSQDSNWAVLDLFTPQHARKVLVAYGRALGALPSASLGREQGRFIDSAIEGLTEGGKVIPVQLALLAEMLKEKPWVPATLVKFGGVGGLAEAFLADRLEGAGAHPLAKAHPQATRELLKLLLPDEESRIRRPAVPKSEVVDKLAGVLSPASIEKLLEALDNDLKLVTTGTARLDRSTESATLHTSSDGLGSQGDSERVELHYQLAHDYLVPSLNRWLHRGEMKSMSGRARFRLRELAKLHRVAPEKRLVPSWFEYLWLRWMTVARTWEPAERELMRQGRQRSVRQVAGTAVLVSAIGSIGFVMQRDFSAQRIVQSLSTSKTEESSDLIARAMRRRDVRARLNAEPDSVSNDLHRGLVLGDDGLTLDSLHLASAGEVSVVANLLRSRRESFLPLLTADIQQRLEEGTQADARQAAEDRQQLLMRLALLAQLAPQSKQWPQWLPVTVQGVVDAPSLERPDWIRGLEPLRPELARVAVEAFGNRIGFELLPERDDWLQVAARLAADDPSLLVELASRCDGGELLRTILPLADKRLQEFSLLAVEQYNRLDLDRIVPFATPQGVKADTWSNLCNRVEQFGGTMTNRGGCVLGVTREPFLRLGDELIAAGLRPSSIAIKGADGKRWNVGLEPEAGNGSPAAMTALEDLLFFSTWIPVDELETLLQRTSASGDATTPSLASEDFSLAELVDRCLQDGTGEWFLDDDMDGGIQTRESLPMFGDRCPDWLMKRLVVSGGSQIDKEQIEDRKALYRLRLESATRSDSKSNYLTRLAAEEWRSGNFEEALARLDEADALQKQATSDRYRIKILCGLGRLDEARAIFEAAEDQRISDRLRVAESAELEAMARETLTMIGAWRGKGSLSRPQQDELFEYVRAAGVACKRLAGMNPELAAETLAAGVDASQFIGNSPGFDRYAQFWIEPDLDPIRENDLFQAWAREVGCDTRVTGFWAQREGVDDAYILTPSATEHARELKRYLARGYRPMSSSACPFFQSSAEAGSTMLLATVLHRQSDRLKSDQSHRRRAVLAVLAAHAGEFGPLVSALAAEGPLQAEAIEVTAAAAVDLGMLVQRLEGTDEQQLQYALLLAIGSVPSSQLDGGLMQRLLQAAVRLSNSSSAGVAAAAEWCCEAHGQQEALTLVKEKQSASAQHRQLDDGTVMVRVNPPEKFVIGSSYFESGIGDNELRHWVHGIRPYELAATEVTVEQFRRFLETVRAAYPAALGYQFSDSTDSYTVLACPQLSVRFLDAMRYCQWKSEQEGIDESQWCYPGILAIRPEELAEFTLPADFLLRRGYRLPLEEEWEWGARAGSALARPFGDSTRLMPRYAHFGMGNDQLRTLPVGSLKPNPWGLFDMLGNAEEWCQNARTAWKRPAYGYARDASELELIGPRPFEVQGRTDDRPIGELQQRIVRGGSYGEMAESIRSGRRKARSPEDKSQFIGFRIARTAGD